MRVSRRTPMIRSLALASLLALSACSTEAQLRGIDPAGSPAPARPSAMPTAIPAADGPVRTRRPVLVLDDGSPQLCLGPVAESYPPQCQGLALTGWDWDDHAGDHEQADQVRWGEFAVTGTFDGAVLRVTAAVPAAQYDAASAPPEPLPGTPCPEPAGGWRVLDPATTTPQTLDATLNAAAALPGYAGAWLDQSINPASTSTDPAVVESQLNDPRRLVLNVALTRDLAGAEDELRRTWGGALCLSRARFTERQLNELALELQRLPGVLSSSAADDVVHVDVIHDDGSIQAWVDAEYGPGRVEVSPALVAAG